MKSVVRKILLVFGLISIVAMLDSLDGCENNMGSTTQPQVQGNAVQQKPSPQQSNNNHKVNIKSQFDPAENLLSDNYLGFVKQVDINDGSPEAMKIIDTAYYYDTSEENTGSAFGYVLLNNTDGKPVIFNYKLNAEYGTFNSNQRSVVAVDDEGCQNCSAEALLTSPSHQMLYVLVTTSTPKGVGTSNSNNTKIIEYSIDSVTGALTYVGEQTVFRNINYVPTGMTVSPDGSMLYVVSTGQRNTLVDGYTVDNNGKLSPASSDGDSLTLSGTSLGALAISSDGLRGALVVNGLRGGKNPSQEINTVQLFNVSNGILTSSGEINATDLSKELNKSYLSPLQVLFSPDSKSLYAIFADSSLMIKYDYASKQLTSKNMTATSAAGDQGEYKPNMISAYVSIDGKAYLFAVNNSGTWQQEQTGENWPKEGLKKLSAQADDAFSMTNGSFVTGQFGKMNNIFLKINGELLSQAPYTKIPLSWIGMYPGWQLPDYAIYSKIDHNLSVKVQSVHTHDNYIEECPSTKGHRGPRHCTGRYKWVPSYSTAPAIVHASDIIVAKLLSREYSCKVVDTDIGNHQYSNELKCVENSN